MTFPHLATIQESTKTNGKYIYSGTRTVQCFLQPLDAASAQMYGISFAQAFGCYLPGTSEITDKMRLRINGKTYGVRGIKNYNYGNLKHKQAILEHV